MSTTKPSGRRMNSMINPNFRISSKSVAILHEIWSLVTCTNKLWLFDYWSTCGTCTLNMHQITFIWQESEKGTLLLINWPGYCQKWYDFSLKILTTRLDAFFPQINSLVESSSYISVKGHMVLFGYGLFRAFSRSKRILLEEVKILTVV